MQLFEKRISELNLTMPKTLKFVLTNGLVESGATCTQENHIVLPNSDYLSHPEKMPAQSYSYGVVSDELKREKPIMNLIKTMINI